MYNKRSRDESCKYSDDTAECTAYNPEDMVIKTETLNRLTDIIKELDPKYRDVFLLRRAYKLSREEIADTFRADCGNGEKTAFAGKINDFGKIQRGGTLK